MNSILKEAPEDRPAREAVRERLLRKIVQKDARIGVFGLGYVGLPLALAFSDVGFSALGFELDEKKAASLNAGRSYIGDITDDQLAVQRAANRFEATTDLLRAVDCDFLIVCVPTPLSITNDPDLSFILNAARQIKNVLRRGQLVVLESTTYPGCTEELLLDELRKSGLELDRDFLLAFSPERIDPGNERYNTRNIPRVVGGCSTDSAIVAKALYEQVVPSVTVMSSARAAETVKLLENTFRAVNIGLVNELALTCYEMNIDIWEIIDAAKSKPYGFMPFYPGPGIGGHCIPLDPAYLSWRGRQFGLESHFIEVAEEINGAMPDYVVRLACDALNDTRKPMNGARVLVVGVTYKKDVGDLRESPAIEIIQALRSKKAEVGYHDPFVPVIEFGRLHSKLRRKAVNGGVERRSVSRLHLHRGGDSGRRRNDSLSSVELSDAVLQQADCVVIVTDHSSIDYARLTEQCSLIIDTRSAIPKRLRDISKARIVRL